MARVQIEIPDNFIFETELTVRVADINYGGHVGNDTMLSLMQEARTQLYRSLGVVNELKLEGSVGQVIADAAVIYKAESFLSDVLIIRISLGEYHKYGFDLYYHVSRKEDLIEVAKGKTGIICFDYEKRKLACLPASFSKKLSMTKLPS
jgi:YbgC/YbaW family acyl-CoA thioester hydrolase